MDITSEGRGNPYDFWLWSQQRDWAVIPAGTIRGFNEDLPIRLQTGTFSWGKVHIERRHGHWLNRLNRSLFELLHEKLGQPGQFYSTEEDSKIKIAMRLAPDALLVLRYIDNRRYGAFLTVTTMYQLNHAIDGENLGRYLSEFRALDNTEESTDKPNDRPTQ